MINRKKVIYGCIFVIILMAAVLFVKDMMCSFYRMDYSIVLGQCVVRGVK